MHLDQRTLRNARCRRLDCQFTGHRERRQTEQQCNKRPLPQSIARTLYPLSHDCSRHFDAPPGGGASLKEHGAYQRSVIASAALEVIGDLGDRAPAPARARLARASAPRPGASACAPEAAWGIPEVRGPGHLQPLCQRGAAGRTTIAALLQRGVWSRDRKRRSMRVGKNCSAAVRLTGMFFRRFRGDRRTFRTARLAPRSPGVRREAVEGRVRALARGLQSPLRS